MFAEVLIEYNTKKIDKTFTYLIPKNLIDELKIGIKVKVPFATKLVNGFVTNIKEEYSDTYDLKTIDSIINPEINLNKELILLGEYLSNTLLTSRISIYESMLPSVLKIKNNDKISNKYETYIILNKSEEEIKKYIENNKRNKKQIEILNDLLVNKEILKNTISGSSLNNLFINGLVKEDKRQVYRINNNDKVNCNITLNNEQLNAVNKVNLNLYKTYLLYGVTGSGKTEVYFSLIDKVINNHKKALVLVPEISLTTQIVKRFYNRFGNIVAIFHSGLSNNEKYDEYLKIIRNEVSIVVGTRSAIFTPINDLGIIIIDEEHSENYKQDNNPRYNAIDVANYRARYNNIPVILGSATPMLETMARAGKGVFELLTLEKRAGNATLPIIKIVDMEPEIKKNNSVISSELDKLIIDRLNKNEQVIILLNRRGFSTTISCSNCGYTFKCPNCDITLTYHKTSNNLRCHYCGYTVLKNELCPECKENSLNYLGLGTEKLENLLKNKYKTSNIVRMDLDTTTNKGSLDKIITDFKEQKYNILLGTQMISKGLDFPNVTLVGIINADSTLNIPDFRSNERTFELLSQTSGRSGRSKKEGVVVIQTFNPDNYTLECVKNNDYKSFYIKEMNTRKQLKYPPYYYLVSIKIKSKDFKIPGIEANKIVKELKNNLDKETIVLGPSTASMFKVNNIYTYQIIIKYKKDDKLNEVLKNIDEMYITNKDIYLEIDINPMRI